MSNAIGSDELAIAVNALREGGVVACATETLFGLLADARSEAAVERVRVLKGRAPDVPIAVLLPSLEAVALVSTGLPALGQRLAERHWPGPLTLLVPAREDMPAALVRAGKIGVRVPGPSPALQLVRAFAGPLTATSANLSGQPAASSAEQVHAAFPSGLAGCVGVQAPGGLASSIVDVTGSALVIVRAGAIALSAADLASSA